MKPNSIFYPIGMLILFGLSFLACNKSEKTPSPNFIVIFCDDLGYGDLACYGNKLHKTPNLDQLAKEGLKFTSFYSSSGVCTPSRSSLMTGSYAQRVDLEVNARPMGTVGRQVLFPMAQKGINPEEYTVAEMLKDQGYATACIGKWHLGDHDMFLPTQHGFDYYYGIPYSNDMNRDICALPLMRNDSVIEAPVNQNTITKRYTEETVKYINDHKDEPFFIYLPHAMNHVPLHVSEDFRGRSENGLYGDAVEEIDWSTGEIIQALKDNGLDKNTIVLFTSDNGAAHGRGGSNLPFSGWKAGTMEGSMREPCIVWGPGLVPAGKECNAITSTMDILPTFASLTKSELPKDKVIDGHDISYLFENPGAESPYEVFYYYQKEQLQAVRKGNWKLHVALDSTYKSIHWGGFKEGRPLKLIDLSNDIKEENDVFAQNPEVVKELQQYAEKARTELGDLGRDGKMVRKTVIVDDPMCQTMQ